MVLSEHADAPRQPTRARRPVEKGAIWHPGPTARIVRAEAGLDLAHFIHLAHRVLSVRAIRRALDAGCCRVNGTVETFGSRLLKRQDVVEFVPLERAVRDHDFQPSRLILSRDDLLVYDKPAGLPVTPDDAGRKWNLLDLLKAHFPLVIPVHRLDADTSGLVVMARLERTARRLEVAFRDHAVHKVYRAIVRGHPRAEGSHRSYLVKVSSQKGSETWASGRGADAREAVTSWKVIERLGPYASLVEISPQSGRYHQIRIHFSEIGHPIYGDRLHGDRQDPIHVTRQLLHAWRMTLPDPEGGPDLELLAPEPAEFAEARRTLLRLPG